MMDHKYEYWVMDKYHDDLADFGFRCIDWKQGWSCFRMTEEDMFAFVSLYDPRPYFYHSFPEEVIRIKAMYEDY